MDNPNLNERSSMHTPNIQLIFIAIIMTVLTNNISVILKYTCFLKSKLSQSSHSQELRQKLADFQKESSTIDMTNDFAKYARLQRKIIKVQDELKKEVLLQTGVDMKNKMILRVIVGLVCAILMFVYNAQPVVQLDPAWLYPVAGFLSWPGGQAGSISFLVWCAISNSVMRTFC